jgi:hypothetical protein
MVTRENAANRDRKEIFGFEVLITVNTNTVAAKEKREQNRLF